MYKLFCLFCIFSVSAKTQPLPVGSVLPASQTSVHDPVLIKQDSTYYLFATGNGIAVWSSKDRQAWKKEAPVFASAPPWAVKAVPGFRGHIWAPDIQYFNGRYVLFYSVSQFGKNTSCIGVAVNKTLDPSSPDFSWKDLGKVVQSVPGRDLWNAIDPALIVDEKGEPWMSFGSWWNGIKLVRLDSSLQVAEPQQWYTIARRPRHYSTPDSASGSAAIEAPFIFKKQDYYYLFVSWDLCCKGEQSTYKIVMGRSKNLQGPYLDKEGRGLDDGGGTILLQGNANWHGVGHNAVYADGNKDWLIFHGYDAKDRGRPKLRLEELAWDTEGWPNVKQ